MERRGFLIAALVVAGIVCGAALSMVTGACHTHLYASWLARTGSGPPAPLPFWCVPSEVANRYAMEVLFFAITVALSTAGLALLAGIAGRLVGAERSRRARRIVGWMNVGALAMMMAAAVGIAGCGEGEVQFYTIPWMLIGSVPAAFAAFTGARRIDPSGGGEGPPGA